MKNFNLIVFVLIFGTVGCNGPQHENLPQGEDLYVEWELITNYNEEDKAEAAFYIRNDSEDRLPSSGWTIYFNQLPSNFTFDSLQDLRMEHISGDFFRIYPAENFDGLAPGETVEFEYERNWGLVNYSLGPSGGYIVYQNKEDDPQPIDIKTVPFTREDQFNRTRSDNFPVPTPQYIYNQNLGLTSLSNNEFPPLIPTPVNYTRKNGIFDLNGGVVIQFEEGLEHEASLLKSALSNLLQLDLDVSAGIGEVNGKITLVTGVSENGNQEGYILKAGPGGIAITGASDAGVFYGIQSLLHLIPSDDYSSKNGRATIQAIHIEDYPRFEYRGLYLDVSRNFHSKQAVQKLIQIMAFYKLNKFHFHLSDDEGWRLEIPDLPELTEVGARRGHTIDERDALHPSYGSGPEFTHPGTGHYTRNEFIEILRFANDHHIEVIPEIDLPGHARAAIKAMETRYYRLLEEGNQEGAEEYLLSDLQDKSEYISVQGYNDNVINVCRESTYNFLRKVVDEIVLMYEEADVPLNSIHIGGDEVPEGVWEDSPDCDNLMEENDELNNPRDLAYHFLRRFNNILTERGLITAGWEEIALLETEDGVKPNPEFTDKDLRPYVWNAVWGWGGEDLAYKLANAGYEVVFANASNLYFDLAYEKAPQEPGLYWAGFVNTRKAWETVPFDILKSATLTLMGDTINIDTYKDRLVSLAEESQQNILGLQGQLWSETIKRPDMLEYYSVPKMLGLAERAWTPQPEWAKTVNRDLRENKRELAWNRFANSLGKDELPTLDYFAYGVLYRIPPPGAVIENNILKANVAFPGFTIRYTTDGTDPTSQSTLYEGPVEVSDRVKLRTFNTTGRGSRTIEIPLNNKEAF